MIVNGWIRQGELIQPRQKLLRLVGRKFAGIVPQEVTRVLGEQESLEVLDLWFDEAIAAESMEGFTAVLRR